MSSTRMLFVRRSPAVFTHGCRSLYTTTGLHAGRSNRTPNVLHDDLENGSAKGRTGGGQPLSSTSANAPPQPRISNLSVPGANLEDELSKEQLQEVQEHNEEFYDKHDRSQPAPEDKVDKKYWTGEARGRA